MSNSAEDELIEQIAGFEHDPLGFVEFAFDWNHGELAGYEGPDDWQRTILQHISDKSRGGASLNEVIQIAVTSGHGSGKVRWCRG